MLFRIFKHFGSHCELNKIKNIRSKVSRKRSYSISGSSSSVLDSDQSLSVDSDQEEKRQPTENKEINKLDHVVTDNIKKKNEHNEDLSN